MAGFYPRTKKEALIYRNKYDVLPVAGGTDIMAAGIKAENMMFLNSVKELKNVKREEGFLKIGAGCTYSELLENKNIPEILKKPVKNTASPAVRNAGTMAGNICNASPAGDSIPVLYALEALVKTESIDLNGNIKTLNTPVSDFIKGVRRTSLAQNELVTEILIPEKSFNNIYKYYYEKVGSRKSESISKLSFIGIIKTDKDIITKASIAFGSVGPTAVKFSEIEKEIEGLSLNELEKNTGKISRMYENKLHPIDDQRSTGEYRKKVCINLLKNFLLGTASHY